MQVWSETSVVVHYCAAEAIFYCPTMNSHRPRSQNTAKEQALIPEKESRRTWPRCHVSLKKSSKNHKPLEKWAKPNLLPDVTPQPANFCGEYFRRVCHVVIPDPPELFAVFSSVSDPDPDPYWIRIQSDHWIRIRIRNLNTDPDPGGQKWPTKVAGAVLRIWIRFCGAGAGAGRFVILPPGEK